MPRLDGSGPMGQGAMTGRAWGSCRAVQSQFVCSRRRGLGLGLGLNRASINSQNKLESLELEEKLLEERLVLLRSEKENLRK